MLTGSGFLFPLHRAHPANQNGRAIHLRRVAVIIGSADGPTNRGPSQCLRFRTLPPNCPATSCFAIADCRTTRLTLRSLSQCTRAAVQAAIWQLGASQSWRANANHCSANTKSLCYLRLLFVEQLKPG